MFIDRFCCQLCHQVFNRPGIPAVLFFLLIMLGITTQNIKSLMVYSALFWIPFLVLSAIANEITSTNTFPGDVALLNYVHANFPEFLAGFFLIVTAFGSALGVVIITSLFLALLVKAGQRVAASVVLVSVAGAAIANLLIKLFFERDRPNLWQSIVQEQSFSFPSGHAMASSALYFALVYATWQTRWRWPTVIIGGVLIILVGFSRLYFGVHFPSDIVAGWLVSFIWVCLVVTILTKTKITTYLKGLSS